MRTIIPDPRVIDWQAEATKWKALARKHERRAKANAEAAARAAALLSGPARRIVA